MKIVRFYANGVVTLCAMVIAVASVPSASVRAQVMDTFLNPNLCGARNGDYCGDRCNVETGYYRIPETELWTGANYYYYTPLELWPGANYYYYTSLEVWPVAYYYYYYYGTNYYCYMLPWINMYLFDPVSSDPVSFDPVSSDPCNIVYNTLIYYHKMLRMQYVLSVLEATYEERMYSYAVMMSYYNSFAPKPDFVS